MCAQFDYEGRIPGRMVPWTAAYQGPTCKQPHFFRRFTSSSNFVMHDWIRIETTVARLIPSSFVYKSERPMQEPGRGKRSFQSAERGLRREGKAGDQARPNVAV